MTKPDIVLGAMYFGTRVNEPSSMALLDRFVDQGGVWIARRTAIRSGPTRAAWADKAKR